VVAEQHDVARSASTTVAIAAEAGVGDLDVRRPVHHCAGRIRHDAGRAVVGEGAAIDGDVEAVRVGGRNTNAGAVVADRAVEHLERPDHSGRGAGVLERDAVTGVVVNGHIIETDVAGGALNGDARTAVAVHGGRVGTGNAQALQHDEVRRRATRGDVYEAAARQVAERRAVDDRAGRRIGAVALTDEGQLLVDRQFLGVGTGCDHDRVAGGRGIDGGLDGGVAAIADQQEFAGFSAIDDLDIREVVGTFGASANGPGTTDVSDVRGGHGSTIGRRIVTGTAVDDIVAGVTCQHVVATVAGDDVVQGVADDGHVGSEGRRRGAICGGHLIQIQVMGRGYVDPAAREAGEVVVAGADVVARAEDLQACVGAGTGEGVARQRTVGTLETQQRTAGGAREGVAAEVHVFGGIATAEAGLAVHVHQLAGGAGEGVAFDRDATHLAAGEQAGVAGGVDDVAFDGDAAVAAHQVDAGQVAGAGVHREALACRAQGDAIDARLDTHRRALAHIGTGDGGAGSAAGG